MNAEHDVGATVRARREQLQLSQQHVASTMSRATGKHWHQTTVAKTESGERELRLSEAVMLARVLQMPFGYLVFGKKV